MSRARDIAATLAFAAFTWTLVLSVSPQLHQQVHHDANRVEHTCAVTFVTSGTFDHATAPLQATLPPEPRQLSERAALASPSVESPFLLASIFEHAPPANS